jgi:hypothetical protein
MIDDEDAVIAQPFNLNKARDRQRGKRRDRRRTSSAVNHKLPKLPEAIQ